MHERNLDDNFASVSHRIMQASRNQVTCQVLQMLLSNWHGAIRREWLVAPWAIGKLQAFRVPVKGSIIFNIEALVLTWVWAGGGVFTHRV